MKVIFAGPSLPPGSPVPAGIALRPPAALGDVTRAVLEGATVIGLIDGVFEQVAPVWHKELLFALAEGITVMGAASMGALRAAECAAYGMIPVGEIAQAYLHGDLEDDDAVALVHGPAELGNLPLTEPLVDVGTTTERLVETEKLSREDAHSLWQSARRLHFHDRTIDAMVRGAGLPPVVADHYRANRISVKGLDALALIERVAQAADMRGERPTTWSLRQPPFWRAHLQRASAAYAS